jgi:uncharacterized protein
MINAGKRKIINDPVYGFVTIDHPLIFDVIQHPVYQRLRRIHQMALAWLVYPGAMHTRFQHSMGAYHLMCMALQELKNKEVNISPEEEVATKIAILLHDIGHGPFSHALESTLAEGIAHEEISQLLMKKLNNESGGQLELTIDIFNDRYHKKFLHQLVSSQLDVDRMDYLNRDSFYTGVHEGVIGYDRIIKMLTVKNGELMVEEKGIYSIEKFIIARRLMYWQVYLHKTVLSAENMLVKILARAKELAGSGEKFFASPALSFFLNQPVLRENFMRQSSYLENFCQLDDYDILGAIKVWASHPDIILSSLCEGLINRHLFKVKLDSVPFSENIIADRKGKLKKQFPMLNDEEMSYFVFTGTATNKAYNTNDERINILFKNGEIKDISSVDNALINQAMSIPIKKFYICYPKAYE